MSKPRGSPVVLHIEVGGDFLLAMVRLYGTDGWNRWAGAMLVGNLVYPSWSECEAEPPLCVWFDGGNADLSGRNLDRLFLALFWLGGARLDGASAVGATFGCLPHASLRNADLRDARLVGDVTGTDFGGARLEGVSVWEAVFDSGCPPVGLPDGLLRQCRQVPGEPEGVGLVRHPVAVLASLAASSTE